MEREKHIRILAWLYIVRGVLMLLGAICVIIACTFGGLFSGNISDTLITPLIGVAVAFGIFILSMPTFLTGMGLLDGKGWARVLAMIIGALNFFSIPLGTALCIYTFWVLWGRDADPHFEGRYATDHDRRY